MVSMSVTLHSKVVWNSRCAADESAQDCRSSEQPACEAWELPEGVWEEKGKRIHTHRHRLHSLRGRLSEGPGC